MEIKDFKTNAEPDGNICFPHFYGCDPFTNYQGDASSVLEYTPQKNPLGIMLAPTGMIPVKPHQEGRVSTPHVPTDSSEIIDTIVECYELGIGGVHIHARNPDGTSTQDPEPFAGIIEKVRFYCPDIIIGVTTSGRSDPSFEGRSRVLEIPGIDIASLTVNSIQFPKSTVVAIEETILKLLDKMQSYQIKPEFEFFDTGGINIVKRFQNKNYYPKEPILCNLLFGNIASVQADLSEISRLKHLIPLGSYCGVGGFGGFQLKANMAAILMGGMMHVRTGIEDNIYQDRQRKILATNQSLVKRVVEMASFFERPIATPDQMRKMIGLKMVSATDTVEPPKEDADYPILRAVAS